LSNADKYDEVVDYLKTEKEDFSRKKIEADNSIKKTKDLRAEVKKLENQLDEVTNEMQKLKPQFDSTTLGIINERENLSTDVAKLSKAIITIQPELNTHSNAIEAYKKRIEGITNELNDLEQQYDDLEIFNKKVKSIGDNEIKSAREAIISSITEEVAELKEERGKIDGVYNLFYLAQTSVHDKSMTVCPLCEQGHLTQDKLDSKIDDLKEKKANISAKIMEKNQRIKSIDAEINGIMNTKKELIAKISTLKNDKNINNNMIIRDDSALVQVKVRLEELTKMKNEKETRLNDLIKLISGGQEEINKEYTKKEKLKKSLLDTIAVKKNEISNSNVEITGKLVKPETALSIIKRYVKILDDLIGYAKLMADRQRQAAASRFNDSIEMLMQDLDFKEFKSVKLNKDFRLYVERLDSKNHEYVTQLVSTLSTSEKLTVALILQIALKETYLPHIPFLVLDDVMEDFDEERRSKIYNYLYDKAKEQNWFVLLTKLNESKPIHIINWSPN
jgi:DNA repair exonuclease SbcCD ATPase subunit